MIFNTIILLSLLGANISDSGVFSFSVDRDVSYGSGTTSTTVRSESFTSSSVPKSSDPVDEAKVLPVAGAPFSFAPPVRPSRSTDHSDSDGGARRRTYADVTKSPVRKVTPVPPVSIKSDAQRNLELALEEWKQRLARLSSLLNGSAPEEFSSDLANDIVNKISKNI